MFYCHDQVNSGNYALSGIFVYRFYLANLISSSKIDLNVAYAIKQSTISRFKRGD